MRARSLPWLNLVMGSAPIEAFGACLVEKAAMAPKGCKSPAKGGKKVQKDAQNKAEACDILSPAGNASVGRTMAEIFSETSAHESMRATACWDCWGC